MEQKDFFIFLSSEDSLSYHKDNVPSNFIVELKERHQLIGEWEVGICDFFVQKIYLKNVIYSPI